MVLFVTEQKTLKTFQRHWSVTTNVSHNFFLKTSETSSYTVEISVSDWGGGIYLQYCGEFFRVTENPKVEPQSHHVVNCSSSTNDQCWVFRCVLAL